MLPSSPRPATPLASGSAVQPSFERGRQAAVLPHHCWWWYLLLAPVAHRSRPHPMATGWRAAFFLGRDSRPSPANPELHVGASPHEVCTYFSIFGLSVDLGIETRSSLCALHALSSCILHAVHDLHIPSWYVCSCPGLSDRGTRRAPRTPPSRQPIFLWTIHGSD